jgi:hypothetical protein
MNDTIKNELGNIVNTFWLGPSIEVCVQEFERGIRHFLIVNTLNGLAEDISEYAARAICVAAEHSLITEDNWEDFCTARGIFTEDN